MIIAQINLPEFDNNNMPVTDAHHYLQTKLGKTYGGFSRWSAGGYWIDGNGVPIAEPVYIYQVAVPDETHASDIWEIAIKAGQLAKQEAVFYVFDGKASIVDLG